MGGMIFSVSEYASSVSEIVGNKTGLCLNEIDLARLSRDFLKEESQLFLSSKEQSIRIRSEDYEALISWLLYKTGFTDHFYKPFEHMSMFLKYIHDEEKLNVCAEILREWQIHWRYSFEEFIRGRIKSINPMPVIEYAENKYGKFGYQVAVELVTAIDKAIQLSPNTILQRITWKDQKKLENLFKSESLETVYGSFFDQRFIHYLINNFQDISEIHWRQFEALTCEYFDRLGYHVEIGPGRNDGGIDLRVWEDKENKKGPASILVQCKREKKKIEKVVVKALWADILDENAKSGLIVTTSAISTGAKEVCNARGYKISEANRETLKKWLLAMRDPGTGIFMGE